MIPSPDRFVWHPTVQTLMASTSHLWLLACAWYVPTYLAVQRVLPPLPGPARIAIRALWFAWNMSLAVFSAVGTFYTSQGTLKVLLTFPTACEWPQGTPWGGPIGWWHLAFGLSKVVELGDTMFLAALRRTQPVPFLHWYHHLMTCAFSYFMLSDFRPYVSLAITINFAIHAVMYTYYALSAINLRPPTHLARAITTAQTAQMFIVTLYTAYQLLSCGYSDVLWMAMLMYILYLALFLRYYLVRYFT